MHRLRAVLAPVFGGMAVALLACAVLLFADSTPNSKSSQHPGSTKKSGRRAAVGVRVAADTEAAVKLPGWWKAGDPVPIVKSNCVRCHLTAGRELTAPVQDFARSVHDLHGMTCSDCHGGDRERDARAHDEQAGFIGTKLSAHMAGCADCHNEQAEQVKSGPHYWDFSKKINLKYPVCIDCHGHHDIEKPPSEFALATVCTECHVHFEKQLPAAASVVAENDRLWGVLRKVQDKNLKNEQPVPDRFHHDLAEARHLTAQLIHPAAKLTGKQAAELNARVVKLRGELESWLAKENASPVSGRSNGK